MIIRAPHFSTVMVNESQPPNTAFTAGPVTVVVDEQVWSDTGILVRALHVTDPADGVDVVVASADTSV